MKGFIEVTNKDNGMPLLINIQAIRLVADNRIAVKEYGKYLEVKETHEEIKDLIKKAMD